MDFVARPIPLKKCGGGSSTICTTLTTGRLPSTCKFSSGRFYREKAIRTHVSHPALLAPPLSLGSLQKLTEEVTDLQDKGGRKAQQRSEERRVGKECRS